MPTSDVLVRVLDGEDTIGGSKILVGWGGEGIFLDFGINYGKWGRYFEEFVKPRSTAGLGDLWRLGLVPRVKGLYRPDVIPKQVAPSEDLPVRSITGVYVSHAHLDHAGLIGLLDYGIPLMASRMSAAILKGIQDAKNADLFSQSVYMSPFDYATVAGQTVLKAKNGVAMRGRDLFLSDGLGSNGFSKFMSELPKASRKDGKGTKGKELEAGDIRVLQSGSGGVHAKEIRVDHSVLGSSGWIIESPNGPIAYSGDLRAHGANGDATRRFLEALKNRPPWLLLMEGTQVHAPQQGDEELEPTTEAEVESTCLAKVDQYRGRLVVADFGPRNIERLQAFLRIARRTGRSLVVLPKDAYLLHAMHAADETVPVPGADLLIFDAPSSQAPPAWEEFVLHEYADAVVHAEDLRTRQGETILCFSFWDIKYLLDIEPVGGCYIYSSSEAHNEEQEIDLERLHNWLELLHLDPYGFRLMDNPGQRRRKAAKQPGFHASGHMPGRDVLDWVRTIRPENLLPVHTENAAVFRTQLEGTGTRVLRGGLG